MPTPNHIELIARALILHDSHALMCRSIAGNYLYLPGGHIDFAEPASEALKRELLEECAQTIAVGPLLLTTESTFNDGSTDHHEVNLVFQSQLFHMEQLDPTAGGEGGGESNSTDGGLPSVESRESHIEFVWIDLAAAADLDIRPTEIKAWLATGGLTPTPHLTNFELPIPRSTAS